MTEILEFIKQGQTAELEKATSANPSLANQITEQGISLLQFATYCRNAAAIEILKKHKTTITIFEAASLGDLETVQQLANENDINAFAPDGFTALGLASFFGHLDLIKWLLANGANPNIAANNPMKVTPLHSACAISNFEIAELLIQNGADVNAKQMRGVTPLHSAAHNGQLEIVQLLIENGADRKAKMEVGKTPLMFAKEGRFEEVIKILEA